MENNNRILYLARIILSMLAIASVFFISTDIAIIFLGFSQLLSGLDEVKLSQGIDSKVTSKGNKTVGIFSIIVGLFMIITYTIKLMF